MLSGTCPVWSAWRPFGSLLAGAPTHAIDAPRNRHHQWRGMHRRAPCAAMISPIYQRLGIVPGPPVMMEAVAEKMMERR